MPAFGAPNVRKLEEKKDVKGLTRALGHLKDWEVRRDAARALGRICHIREGEWEWARNGPPPCVEPLTAMLSDENPEVSHAAIWAVCKMGQALGILAAIRQDESTSAEKRQAVEEAWDSRCFSAFTEYTQIWSLHGVPGRKK